MKVILTFPPMSKECEEIIVRWLNECASFPDPENPNLLRYVEKVEVEE
jgi:hypothetical protein